MRIEDLRLRALALVETDTDLQGQTKAKYARYIDHFCRSMHARGIEFVADLTTEAIGDFLAESTIYKDAIAEPSENTQRLRMNAYNYLRRQLHTLGFDLPDAPKGDRWEVESTIRPLNDIEMQLVLDHCRLRLLTNIDAVYVALARCGATTGEMAHILYSDVDLPSRTVRLRNGRGDRSNGIDVWSLDQLGTHMREANGSPWELLLGPDLQQSSIRSQASGSIRSSLDASGLKGDLSVRPSSIRNWSARSLHDLGAPIEDVAKWLGLASLDTATQAIGYDWRVDG